MHESLELTIQVGSRPIQTSRDRFAAVLGERPRARVLVEASTESEWVARCLEQLGHDVIVADPNFAPMYATRSQPTTTTIPSFGPSDTELTQGGRDGPPCT